MPRHEGTAPTAEAASAAPSKPTVAHTMAQVKAHCELYCHGHCHHELFLPDCSVIYGKPCPHLANVMELKRMEAERSPETSNRQLSLTSPSRLVRRSPR